jgi:proteasome assembly chaperone 4
MTSNVTLLTLSMTFISVETRFIPSADSSLPSLALQVSCLVDSYMIWIGTTECVPEDVHKAASQGSLTRDWACAMPPVTVCLVQSLDI